MDNQVAEDRALKLGLSLQGTKSCMGIGKGVIRALGNPDYVSFSVSDAHDSISVFPCDEDDVMSFKVPERLFSDVNCTMRINSKQFVHRIMKSNDLDVSRTYTLSGEYIEDMNSAVFSLTDGITMFSRNTLRKTDQV